MKEPRPTTKNTRTGSAELRTVTALVRRMRWVRAAAAPRMTAGAESRYSRRWCSPIPNTSDRHVRSVRPSCANGPTRPRQGWRRRMALRSYRLICMRGLAHLCDHFAVRSLLLLNCVLFLKFFRCEQPELLKRSVELFHLLFGQC